MEKAPRATEVAEDTTPIPPQVGNELSERSSHETSPSLQEDLRPQLARTISAPPYTIFTHRAKIFIIASVSISSLISPFGATTFYPALNQIAADLHVTPTLINLSLTTYMVRRPSGNHSEHSH